MTNFNPKIGFDLATTLAELGIGPPAKPAPPDPKTPSSRRTGYELDSETDRRVKEIVYMMDQSSLRSMTFNSIFQLAKDIPDAFKKLMNG